MLRITESKDEIIVRETPALQWVNAFGAALVFFFTVYVILKSVGDFSELLQTLVVLVPFGGILLFLLTNPLITVKINKQSKIISVRKQSLIKYTFNVYSFNEVADFIYVDEDKTLLGNKSYQLMMLLTDGQKIAISHEINRKEKQLFKTADLINNYIFDSSKQIPFKLTVHNDD